MCHATFAYSARVFVQHRRLTAPKKATIHQVTTMLATSKNVLFPGHNHLLTTGTDDLMLSLSPEHQDIFKVAIMVVTWWIVAFFAKRELCDMYYEEIRG